MDFDASTPTYAHDANGNLTGDGVFSYAYDAANQLTNVVRTADGARVLSARYDALGRRIEAIRADGTIDRYVYFPGSFLVLAVLDGINAVKEVYTRGPDLSGTLDSAGGIGGILACTYASGATYCFHADIMGNVIALTDASGSVAATFRYTPFGQLSARTGTILPRYLFSSKEFDRTANLYYYGYRYYSPNLGRWLSRDPLGEKYFSAFMNASYKKESYNPNKLNLHNQILLDQVHVFYIAVSNSPLGIHDGLGLVCGSGIFDHIIPDAPGGFDFTPCCQGHDDCYGDCKNRPPKEDCDDEFLNCMLGRCITEYAGAHGCANAAYAYYGAVHNYGGAAFENARASCEDCQ